ncbi:hypothetical protein K431DRAFT_346266 [Polychaeton citri CBS 116435]|uniref:Septation initiation network scaffold protein cdc11 n=1 Tax=Polychaeton citri CBS 116435 TaxID=1314669 RepID=A0A9P4Q8N6_9PEZI|nr:hypothetical protein K431DRAFT_346266 [Polychaeton citri CBS 116435]
MSAEVAPWLAGLDDAWEMPSHAQKTQQVVKSFNGLAQPSQSYNGIVTKPIEVQQLNGGSLKAGSQKSITNPRSPLATLNSNQANSLRQRNDSVKQVPARSISELSTGSVMQYGTVQQRSKSASPSKKQETLEWKKRLINGKVGYGDQTDLFGATGLENIFMPSCGLKKTGSAVEKRMNWMPPRPENVIPSSPPLWSASSSQNMSQNGLDEMREEFRLEGFSDEDADEESSFDNYKEENPEGSNSGDAESGSELDQADVQHHQLEPSGSPCSHVSGPRKPAVGGRTVSGQTDLEGFSPVFISKQTSHNGQINYAALDSHTIRQFERLGLDSKSTEQRAEVQCDKDSSAPPPVEHDHSTFSDGPSLETTQPPGPDFSLSENLPTGTPPVASLGRHIELERGGYSRIGSFKQRLLSSSPEKTHASLLSVPSEGKSSGPRLAMVGPSTPVHAPYETKGNRGLSGSPLKIFGAHDTFTNNRLMRRLSQINPDVDEGQSRQMSSGTGEQESPSGGSFGNGELDGHEFDAHITLTNASDESNNSIDGSPDASAYPPGSKIAPEFQATSSPSQPYLQTLKRKLSKRSLRSSRGSAVETLQLRTQACNPSVEDVTDVDLQRHHQDTTSQAFEGKRPPTSPSKNPTPKRRRTLHVTELDADLFKGSMSLPKNDCTVSRKRKDARPGNGQTDADPDVLAQRKMLRPRNPTPSQRRAFEIEEDINEAADAFAAQQPERLQELMDQLDASGTSNEDDTEELQQQAETIATEVAEFTIRVTQASGDFGERKRSLNTQDFTAEAMKVMSALRARHDHRSGLSSVEESNHEAFSEPFEAHSSRLPLSPTLSPTPSVVNPTSSKSQSRAINGARVTSHLKRFEETDETQYLPDSETSLRMDEKSNNPGSIVLEDEFSKIRVTVPSGEHDLEQADIESSQPNSYRTVSTQHSSGSTKRTPGTGSTKKSDNLGTLAPDAVGHLIGPAMGQMSFDSQRGCWVKSKGTRKQASPFLEPPSQLSMSDDDPLREISDLPVDEQLERRRISSPTKTTGDGAHAKHEGDHTAPPNTAIHGKGTTPVLKHEAATAPRPVTRDSSHMAEAFHHMHSSSMPSRHTGWGSSQIDGIETRATSWSDEELRRLSAMDKSRQVGLAQAAAQATIAQQHHLENLAELPESPGQDTERRLQQQLPLLPDHMSDLCSNSTRSHESCIRASPSSIPTTEDRTTLETQKISPCHESCESLSEQNGLVEESFSAPKARLSPGKALFPSSPRTRDGDRQISLRRQTLTNRFAQPRPVHEVSELSFVAPLPGERMMSISLSVSRPVNTGTGKLEKVRDLESSPIKGDPGATFFLSDLPDFTVNDDDELARPSEKALARRLALHARQEEADRYALSRSQVVKTLTDEHQDEPYWEDLRQLDLQSRSLSALVGLEDFCSGIRILNVSDNVLMDTEGAPTSVRHLTAQGNALDNLTSWTHLMNLQYLDISNNRLENMSSLECLLHMRELSLANNEVTDLTGLKVLEGLLKLDLSRNKIHMADFDDLHNAQLQELDLSANRISEVLRLEVLPHLKVLRLDGNQDLKTFTVSRSMPELQELSIQDCGLVSLDVTQFPALRKLYVDNNSLQTVTGLSTLKHLDVISMRNQTLSEDYRVSILEKVFDARTVRLSYNKLPSLKLSDTFHSIQNLELASVGLQELPENFGSSLPNLRKLNLDFNFLKDLRHLHGIHRIEEIKVCGNRIDRLRKTIGLFSKLGGSICTIDLRDNPVTQGLYSHTMFDSFRKALVAHQSQSWSSSTLSLPPRDHVQDAKYQERLDDDTKLKRRVYEIMVAQACTGLKQLDGADFVKEKYLAKDWIWERLVNLGIVRRSGITDRGE